MNQKGNGGHGPCHLCKKTVGSAVRKRQPYTATFSCDRIWYEIGWKRKQEPVVNTVAWNSTKFYPIRPFPAVRHLPGQ